MNIVCQKTTVSILNYTLKTVLSLTFTTVLARKRFRPSVAAGSLEYSEGLTGCDDDKMGLE